MEDSQMLKKILTLLSAAAVITAVGCASKPDTQVKKDTVVKVEQKAVVKLKLTPLSGKVTIGSTMKFEVTGLDAAGKTVNVSADWKLTGGKTAVGTLDTTKGNVVTFTAKAAGNATLETEYNNIKASAAIEVIPTVVKKSKKKK
jgi:hypothetical protein